MAQRPYWSGQIRVSLVSFPVTLQSATRRGSQVPLHELSRRGGERVHHRNVTEDGKIIDRDDIVKGFEIAKDEYVVLEPEEIDGIRLPSSDTLELDEFTDLSAIPVLHFERPYFVLPAGKKAEEIYGVFADALKAGEQRLADIKLSSFLKATGGKDLHVVVPIARRPDWKTVKDFAKNLAAQMTRDAPDLYTIHARKTERKGRIFIDYLRNDKTASAIAPYSTRARPNAPVAVPLHWRELTGLNSAHEFTMPLTLRRLQKMKDDPWKNIEKLKQSLPA